MHLGTQSVIVSVVFTAISGTVLTLRCISRLVALRKIGLDDIFAILAYLSSVAFTGLIYIQYQHGLGQDMALLPSTEVTTMLKFWKICLLAYAFAITFLKVSACLQYLRFLVERWQRTASWAMIIACVVFGSCGLIINILECRPISYSWDKTIPGGTCVHILAWWMFTAVWVIVTDLIVVALPIIAIKDINIPRRQKVALMFVFALGLGGCVMSFLRLHCLITAAVSPNVTRDRAEVLMWSSLELNIGVTCISIPPLKALVVAVSSSLMGSMCSTRVDDRTSSTSDTLCLRAPGTASSSKSTPKQELDPWVIP